MPPTFSHRSPAPLTTRDYRRFRPYIREDFQQCCAYCLLYERFANGEEAFELDHFRPKSDNRFAHLENEYSNLYYSCHVCNRTKWKWWPPKELEVSGFRFADPCQESFSDNFVDQDGEWQPQTRAGQYSEERLRLNREHLVQIRRHIAALLRDRGLALDWDRPMTKQIAPLLDSLR